MLNVSVNSIEEQILNVNKKHDVRMISPSNKEDVYHHRLVLTGTTTTTKTFNFILFIS
jgi:hypothetical protein